MVLLFQCFQVIINFQYEKSIHISVKGYPKTTVWFEERVYGSRLTAPNPRPPTHFIRLYFTFLTLFPLFLSLGFYWDFTTFYTQFSKARSLASSLGIVIRFGAVSHSKTLWHYDLSTVLARECGEQIAP